MSNKRKLTISFTHDPEAKSTLSAFDANLKALSAFIQKVPTLDPYYSQSLLKGLDEGMISGPELMVLAVEGMIALSDPFDKLLRDLAS